MTPAILEMKKKKGGRVDANNEAEVALRAFSDAIEAHEYLEIDGIENEGQENEAIKVLNHEKKRASSVTVDAILGQPLNAIIEALETGITLKLYGITRIVGYYSRISNWNKSKLGELQDRHSGNYSVRTVA